MINSKNRLLNKLFTDPNFNIDNKSEPYIVRDIINMNWWNTCEYLIGYRNNSRISSKATYEMKLMAIILKEYYRIRLLKLKNKNYLIKECIEYITKKIDDLPNLKIHSMEYRKNDSQYFYKNGKSTWLDCTSRATYAWKYIGQNGYIDFDGICRVKDGNKILNHCKFDTVYPDKDSLLKLFDQGRNRVKEEIFSQKRIQYNIDEWIQILNIDIINPRKWLYDKIKNIKTDPFKINEKKLLKNNLLFGNNELLYGYKTTYSLEKSRASNASSASDASSASGASHASRTSNASHASRASNASGASRASNASGASRASNASGASHASNANKASGASSASDASYASGASRASTASRASNASSASDASHASFTSRASRASNASSASSASSASTASRTSDASHASSASRASDASSASDASGASHASSASDASRASRASSASHASRASNASNASGASSASDVGVTGRKNEEIGGNWFDVPSAIGEIKGLEHPPVYKNNKYGIAGHWKINKQIVSLCKLGWFDPFMGHGESPLYAKRMNKNYVGIEINSNSMNGYLNDIQKTINLFKNGSKVEMRLGDSSIFYSDLVNRFDLCYTSPPYFDFEDYGFHNKTIQECKNYDEYHKKVTIPTFINVKKYLIKNGMLCIQTEKENIAKKKWIKNITSIGFKLLKDTITGREKNKYSNLSKRDQTLLIFINE